MIFCEQQLEFLFWLKELRGPIQDLFFRFLNCFDTGEFLVALVALIWVGFSRKWGIRSFYLVSFAMTSCMGAKLYFALPRPIHLYPELGLLHIRSYGFPSGGAENAIIVASMLILYWKNRLAWPLALLYFLLISFSRMYLGVHFPLDVLGGWVLGLIVVTLFYCNVGRIEHFANRHLKPVTLLSIVIPLALWALFPESRLTFGFKALAGGAIGIWASRHYHHIQEPPRTPKTTLIRALFGVLSTLALFHLTRNSFITYLWISWIASLALLCPHSKETHS